MKGLFKKFPFSETSRERGETSLIFVGLLAAASFVGVTALVKRAVDDGKMAKLNERKANASQNPISAAIFAKSLFAAPVPGSWTTPQLVANPALLPNMYMDPYISSQSVLNGSPPGSLRIMNPSPNLSPTWDSSFYARLGAIYVNTADRNRLTAAAIEGLMSDAADGGAFQINAYRGIGKTKTTISNFVTTHCSPPPNFLPSTVFTGYYCVQADFSTENYSQLKSGPQGTNKATVFLGALQTPPAPACNGVTVPATVQPGDNINVDVKASGVVTGYTMTATATIGGAVRTYSTVDVSKTWTAANSARSSAVAIPINLNLSNLALYNYTTMPANTVVNVNVTLKGVTGNAAICSARMTVKRPDCTLAMNKPTYFPGEQVIMRYTLIDSRPSDVSTYQQSNIVMSGSTPASPDGAWTLTGVAPNLPSARFSASVTLKRGPIVLDTCAASAITQPPCQPNPRFTSGRHYGPQRGFDPNKYRSIPGSLPFELYNEIINNPSGSSLIDTSANRINLCQTVFGPYAWPWGGGQMTYHSPGDNTVCAGFNGAGCQNARAAGNPMHISWTLCRCDTRVPP